MDFKCFLLNEEQSYLGHRLADVLTAVHDLENDLGGMGTRQISRIAEDIVNQIRVILHSQWSSKQKRYLKDIQRVGVALMKAIEEKDNLKELIPQLSQELGRISTKLGIKVNNLEAVPSQDEVGPQDMQLTGNGPTPQQPNQQQPPQLPQPNQQQPPPQV